MPLSGLLPLHVYRWLNSHHPLKICKIVLIIIFLDHYEDGILVMFSPAWSSISFTYQVR